MTTSCIYYAALFKQLASKLLVFKSYLLFFSLTIHDLTIDTTTKTLQSWNKQKGRKSFELAA